MILQLQEKTVPETRIFRAKRVLARLGADGEAIEAVRILFLTPGTGSFYCGTCMRDNALAVALRRLGHDALLVPMYLPPTLDEASAADGAPLFYGGINVYLQQVSRLFRKTPRWLDQLLDAPGALAGAAKRAGMTLPRELGPLTLSMLLGEDGNQNKELDRLVAWLAADGRADVVVLSNALLVGLARRIKKECGSTVLCTLHGEDTFLDALPEPDRTRCWEAVAERGPDVDRFVAVSRYHAELMQQRARLDPSRVDVVYNGIDLTGYSPAPHDGPPTIGYLARMCPTKGLHALVDAFLILHRRGSVPDLHLKVAGAQTLGDVKYVETLMERIDREGAGERVAFFPNVDRAQKIDFLRSLTVLSVPATYGESFGLYVVEALAAGVPVVQPRHAVFPELLAATGGGELVAPDDPEGLADGLERRLLDREGSRALGGEGREQVLARFGVDTMAQGVLDAIERTAPA